MGAVTFRTPPPSLLYIVDRDTMSRRAAGGPSGPRYVQAFHLWGDVQHPRATEVSDDPTLAGSDPSGFIRRLPRTLRVVLRLGDIDVGGGGSDPAVLYQDRTIDEQLAALQALEGRNVRVLGRHVGLDGIMTLVELTDSGRENVVAVLVEVRTVEPSSEGVELGHIEMERDPGIALSSMVFDIENALAAAEARASGILGAIGGSGGHACFVVPAATIEVDTLLQQEKEALRLAVGAATEVMSQVNAITIEALFATVSHLFAAERLVTTLRNVDGRNLSTVSLADSIATPTLSETRFGACP